MSDAHYEAVLTSLDGAEADLRAAKHALHPESLASVPDWDAVRAGIARAQVRLTEAYRLARVRVP